MAKLTKARDPKTGQFSYANGFSRMCKCGHTLGVHVSGGFECVNRDAGDGTPCSCRKFQPAPAFHAGDDNG